MEIVGVVAIYPKSLFWLFYFVLHEKCTRVSTQDEIRISIIDFMEITISSEPILESPSNLISVSEYAMNFDV